jgi:solute carrier family 25 thiamine pyrophosphate transporter 19
MYHYCQQTVLTKGFPGFYAGMSAALLSIAPYMGLNFGLYELFKFQLSHNFNSSTSSLASLSPSFFISLISGGVAGGISKILIYPLDTIKKRLQSDLLINTVSHSLSEIESHNIAKYHSFGNCLNKIWLEEGVKGYYKGLVPTLLKSIFSTSIAFGTFEVCHQTFSSYCL